MSICAVPGNWQCPEIHQSSHAHTYALLDMAATLENAIITLHGAYTTACALDIFPFYILSI